MEKLFFLVFFIVMNSSSMSETQKVHGVKEKTKVETPTQAKTTNDSGEVGQIPDEPEED